MDSPAGNGLLVVEELALAFGGLQVLEGVTLTVPRGEIFALVGPNGAGKTSVLNCLSGIYRPGSGRIRYAGRDIAGMPPHRIAQIGIARSFQFVELFPRMTAVDNLLLGRHIHMRTGIVTGGLYWGWASREEVAHRRKVEEIIDFLELDAYRKRRVVDLSYGVQKLVGVGRALAMEPRLLLLDEPSTGLNREEKENLARFLLRIKHELGTTILWVEHDMELVADLADTVSVLHFGQKIAEGPPDQVLGDPRVAEVYLGRPFTRGKESVP